MAKISAADVIYHGGKIITANDRFDIVSSVAIPFGLPVWRSHQVHCLILCGCAETLSDMFEEEGGTAATHRAQTHRSAGVPGSHGRTVRPLGAGSRKRSTGVML